MPNPMLIEVCDRMNGRPLVKMPLYEFLLTTYWPEFPDEYCFEDLAIKVDGKDLAPSQCARA
jgi:hypothetical protein